MLAQPTQRNIDETSKRQVESIRVDDVFSLYLNGDCEVCQPAILFCCVMPSIKTDMT